MKFNYKKNRKFNDNEACHKNENRYALNMTKSQSCTQINRKWFKKNGKLSGRLNKIFKVSSINIQ